MQLHCTYCHSMFTVSQAEILAGLEHMQEHKQAYYDAHCPHCRRANRVERIRLERAYPGWEKAIQEMAGKASPADGADAEKK